MVYTSECVRFHEVLYAIPAWYVFEIYREVIAQYVK